jgi:hypothetical protein
MEKRKALEISTVNTSSGSLYCGCTQDHSISVITVIMANTRRKTRINDYNLGRLGHLQLFNMSRLGHLQLFN